MITVDTLSIFDFDGSVAETINILQSLMYDHGNEVRLNIYSAPVLYGEGEEIVVDVQIEP